MDIQVIKNEFRPVMTDFMHLQDVLRENEIIDEGNVDKEEIRFCKVESQMQAIFGTLSIPDLEDLVEKSIPVALFITEDKIVIADDDGIVMNVMKNIQHLKRNPYESKEKFLYYLLTGLISRAFELLDQIEDSLISLEKEVLADQEHDFNQKISHYRQELLILRSYYEEISDVGKALEEDENEYFEEELLKYFGTVSDRADRLANKAAHLIDFAREVKETYDSKISAKQNANMEYLTVITSVFFPLTLITGWYGMNFDNMPELSGGYPYVIVLSMTVIILLIVVFKKKKML